jgi:cytochrome P450
MLMEPLFGGNAFVLHNGDEHAIGRDAIMPAFHGSRVQSHAGLITEIVEHEIASWPADVAFPLLPHLDRLTLRVMLMTSIACREPAYEMLCRQMLDMLSVMSTPLLQEPRLRRLPGWRKMWRRFLHQRDKVDDIVLTLIVERRRENDGCESNRENTNGAEGDSDHEDDGDHGHGDDHGRDLIDMLLAARNSDGSPMSDRQVRDNLMSVIIAGHETTAATLAWTFQLLAHNPAVQDQLIEEIDGGVDETYLNATIQEALRHKPTFLFLPPRVVVRPTEIGGWSYRPPTQLLACIYLMHHDPELYPNPHIFAPERFLQREPQPGTLMPWGGGRKRCPGRGLALMEIRTVLRQALSRWLVLPAGEHIERPRWRTALLAPHDGSKVILRERRSCVRTGTAGGSFNLERFDSI